MPGNNNNEITEQIAVGLLKQHKKGKKVSVIIGAGASHYDRLGPEKLKDPLLKKINREYPNLKASAISHINKLPEECTLEELLSVYASLNKNDNDACCHFLNERGINSKHDFKNNEDLAPIMSYEIISHLINYRIINNVISFNFDEYLELSLDREIGNNGYDWIISRSVFQKAYEEYEAENNNNEQGSQLSRPLLIKPHGTISYPATIRPTCETVQTFEEEKSRLLNRVLQQSRVILIMGCSCADTDFQKVLKTLILEHPEKKIIWVDPKEQGHMLQNHMFDFINKSELDDFIYIEDDADSFLEELAGKIREKDDILFPTIASHKVKYHFREEINSYDDLFKIETIIYAIKSRGMFSLEGLLTYNRDEVNWEKKRLSLKKVFNEILGAGFLKRADAIRSAEAYYIPSINSEEDNKTETALATKVHGMLSVKDHGGEKTEALSGYIKELMNSFDFDLGEPDDLLFLKFYSPEVINNYSDLIKRTEQVISQASVEVNIISETGEWIIKRDEYTKLVEQALSDGVKIRLILAQQGPQDSIYYKFQTDYLNSLSEIAEKNDYLQIEYLPWDEHNIHMTFNEKGEGIYFHRKYKSPLFTPVYISNKQDQNILKDIFSECQKSTSPDSEIIEEQLIN